MSEYSRALNYRHCSLRKGERDGEKVIEGKKEKRRETQRGVRETWIETREKGREIKGSEEERREGAGEWRGGASLHSLRGNKKLFSVCV